VTIPLYHDLWRGKTLAAIGCVEKREGGTVGQAAPREEGRKKMSIIDCKDSTVRLSDL
jgi:hypothetical protein